MFFTKKDREYMQADIRALQKELFELKELVDVLGYERVSYAEKVKSPIYHHYWGPEIGEKEEAVLKYKWQKKEPKKGLIEQLNESYKKICEMYPPTIDSSDLEFDDPYRIFTLKVASDYVTKHKGNYKGRKPGSKNKRKPGRPKGSKTKK